MSKYPSDINTIINAEKIISEINVNEKDVIKEVYDDKLYVIQCDNNKIMGCLVFDLDGKLIDHYDNCVLLYDDLHEAKTYYQWIKNV